MVVSSVALGTVTNGEYTRTTGATMPCTASSGAATALSAPMLETRREEDDDWVYVRSGVADTDLESPAQGQRDPTELLKPTTERRSTA